MVRLRRCFRAWQTEVFPAKGAAASRKLSSPLFGYRKDRPAFKITMADVPFIINGPPYKENETEEQLKQHAFDYYLKGQRYQEMAWCATGECDATSCLHA